MNKITAFCKQRGFLILLSITLILGGLLRFYRYFEFPIFGETADEWAWTWLGASLWQTGQPISWSYFKEYQEKYIYEVLPSGAPLVTPDLDQPPFFGLLAGVTHALSSPWRAQPSSKVIRLPLVVLGCLNLSLLTVVAYRLLEKDKKLTLLAAILYATLPVVVFSSRLVVAENFLITLELIMLLLLASSSLSVGKKNLFLILVSILAVMSKVSGIIVPLTVLLNGLLKKDKQEIKVGALGVCLGFLLLLFYASFFNFNLFVAVQLSQGGRELGLSTLINRFFIHPTLVRDLFVDGWLIFGLFGFFSLVYNWKEQLRFQPAILAGLLTLAFIVFASGERTYHGWYYYPVLPILVLAIVFVWQKMLKTKNTLLFILNWLLLLPALRLPLVYLLASTQLNPFLVRSLSLLAFLPLASQALGLNNLTKKLMIMGLVLLILANIVTVLTVNQTQYWLDNSYFNDQY